MRIQVRLLFNLKEHAPGGQGQFALDLAPGTTLGQVLASLGIPEQPAKVMLLNGIQASLDQAPREGDDLVVFPPVEGG